MKLTYCLKILIIFLLTSINIHAQIFVEKELEEGVTYMVNFIISDYYDSLSQSNSDLDLIDTLYLRSLNYHNYSIDEALLALTFATLAFNEMPLHFPFTNIKLAANLPAGPDGTLQKKKLNIPKQIFVDSPQTNFGDKDKVAHFFGNAYLSNSVSIFNLSKFLSILVELFEDSFKVEGTIDNRDFIANFLGYHFGKQVSRDEKYLPSQSLRIYTFFKINYCY